MGNGMEWVVARLEWIVAKVLWRDWNGLWRDCGRWIGRKDGLEGKETGWEDWLDRFAGLIGRMECEWGMIVGSDRT